MFITRNGRTQWVPDYGGEKTSSLPTTMYTNPLDAILKIVPAQFSVKRDVMGQTPLREAVRNVLKSIDAEVSTYDKRRRDNFRKKVYKGMAEGDDLAARTIRDIRKQQAAEEAERQRKKEEEVRAAKEKQKRDEDELIKKHVQAYVDEHPIRSWFEDKALKLAPLSAGALGLIGSAIGNISYWGKDHAGLYALRDLGNAIGSKREDLVETYIKSLHGELDLLDIKDFGANVHEQAENINRSIQAIKEQRALNAELYGISQEDLLKPQKDQRTLEYLASDQQYARQLEELQNKANNPALKQLDNIYKADIVRLGRDVGDWLSDAWDSMVRAISSSVGSIDPAKNEQLRLNLAMDQQNRLAADYDASVVDQYFNRRGEQEIDRIINLSNQLRNPNLTKEEQQDINNKISAARKRLGTIENDNSDRRRARATLNNPSERREYLRRDAEDYMLKQYRDNIKSQKERLLKDIEDETINAEKVKEFWNVTEAYKRGKELYRDEPLWSKNYWWYEVPSMIGSTLSSPWQIASMGVLALGTAASFIPGVGPMAYNASMLASTPMQVLGGSDENKAEIHDKRIQNMKDMLSLPEFVGQDGDTIMDMLTAQSKVYWMNHGLTEKQVEERFSGQEGVNRVIEDLIANRTFIAHPGVQKALLFSTRGLPQQFWANNLRTMGEIPIQTMMLMLPTKDIKALSEAEMQVASRGARRVLSKDGELVAEKAGQYANGFRTPTVKDAWKRGKQVGEALGDMVGGGVVGGQIGKYVGGGFAAAQRAFRNEFLPKGSKSFLGQYERAITAKYRGIADALTPSSRALQLLARYGGLGLRRGIASSFSEGAEEAVQYLNSQEDFANKYNWNVSSLSELIENDLYQGGRVLDFYLSAVGLSDSELLNDLEFVENWKGGFALGGGHTQIVSAPAMIAESFREYKANAPEVVTAFVKRDLDAVDRAAGVGIAKSAMQGQGALILLQIDKMQRADSLRANPEFSQEAWDARKAEALQIIAMANDKGVRTVLEAKGFNYGTDKYANAVADMFNILDKIERNEESRELNAVDLANYYASKTFEDLLEDGIKLSRQSPAYVEHVEQAMDRAEAKVRKKFAEFQKSEKEEGEETEEFDPIDNSKLSRLDEEVKQARLEAREDFERGVKDRVKTRLMTMDKIHAILNIKSSINGIEDFFSVLRDKFGLKTLRQDTKAILKNLDELLKTAKVVLKNLDPDFNENASDEEVLKFISDNRALFADDDQVNRMNSIDVILKADKQLLDKRWGLATSYFDISSEDPVLEEGASEIDKKLHERAMQLRSKRKKYFERDKKRYNERIDKIMQADLDNKTIAWIMTDVFSGDAISKLEEDWAEEDDKAFKEELEKTKKEILDEVGINKTAQESTKPSKPKADFGKNHQKWERRKARAKQQYLDRKKKWNKWKRNNLGASFLPLDIFVPLINKGIELTERGVYSIAEFVEDAQRLFKDTNMEDLKRAYIQAVSDIAKSGDLNKLRKVSSLQDVLEYSPENRPNPATPPAETKNTLFRKLLEDIDADKANIIEEISSYADIVVNENGQYKVYTNQIDFYDWPRSWLYRHVGELRAANTSDESFANKLKEILQMGRGLESTFDITPYVKYRNIDGIEEVVLRAVMDHIRGLSEYVVYASKVRSWTQAIMLGNESLIQDEDVTPEFIQQVKGIKDRLERKGYRIVDTSRLLFGQDFDGNDVNIYADIVAVNDETGDVIIGDIFSSYRNMSDLNSLEEVSRFSGKSRILQEEDILNQCAAILIKRYGMQVKSLFAICAQYDGRRTAIDGPAKTPPTILRMFNVDAQFTTDSEQIESLKTEAAEKLSTLNRIVEEYNSLIDDVKGGEKSLYNKLETEELQEYNLASEYLDYINALLSRIESAIDSKERIQETLVQQEDEIAMFEESILNMPDEENVTVQMLRNVCEDLDMKLNALPMGPAITEDERKTLEIIYRTIFDAQDILNEILVSGEVDTEQIKPQSQLIMSAIEKVILNQGMFNTISKDVMQQWLDAFVPNINTGSGRVAFYYRNAIMNWLDALEDHILNDIESSYPLLVWYSTLLNNFFTPLLNRAYEFADKFDDQILRENLFGLIKEGRELVNNFNIDYDVLPDNAFQEAPKNEIERINRMPIKWRDLYGVSDKHSPSYTFINDLSEGAYKVFVWITNRPDLLQNYAATDNFSKEPDIENKKSRFRIYRDTDGEIKFSVIYDKNSIIGIPFIVDESRYKEEYLEYAKRFNNGNRRFIRAVSAMLDYIAEHPEKNLKLSFNVTRNKGKIIYGETLHNASEFLFKGETNAHNLFDIRISEKDGVGLLYRVHNKQTGKYGFYVYANGVHIGGFDEEYDKQKLAIHSGALIYFYKNADGTSIGTMMSKAVLGNNAENIEQLVRRYVVDGQTYLEQDGVRYNIRDLLSLVLYLGDGKKLTNFNSTTNLVTLNQQKKVVYISQQPFNLANEKERKDFIEALRVMEYTTNEAQLNSTIADSNNSVMNQVIQQIRNGAEKVTLPNGFVITKEDVINNTTWLGYMIRNNYIGTKAEATSYRQLNISNAQIVPIESDKKGIEKTTDEIRENKKTSVSEEMRRLFGKARRASGLNMVVEKEDLVNRTNDERDTFEKEAKAYFDQVFGSNDDVKVVDKVSKILEALPESGCAVGLTTSSIVEIAKNAPEEAIYHEAFHKLMELLLTEEERNEFYEMYRNRRKIIRKGGYRKLSDREVAEGLTDLFTSYVSLDKKAKDSSKKWYSKFVPFAKKVLLLGGMYYRLGVQDARKMLLLYTDFNGGKYKTRDASLENKQRFQRLFNDALYYTVTNYDTKKQAEFKELSSAKDVNDMVRGISYLLLDSTGILDEIQPDTSVISISDEAIHRIPQPTIDVLTGAGKREDQLTHNERAFREVFKLEKVFDYDKHGQVIGSSKVYPNMRVLLSRIKVYIESITKAYSSTLNNDLENDEEEKVIHTNIDKYDKSSVEFDKLDSVDQVVKLFFATIPYSKFEDGELVNDFSRNQFGLPELMPITEVYKRVVADLGDVNSIEEFNSALSKLATEDAMYARIYDKWKILYDGLYTQDENDPEHHTYIDFSKEAMCINIVRAAKSHSSDFIVSLTSTKNGYKDTKIKNSSEERDSRSFASQWNMLLSSGTYGIFLTNRVNDKLVFKSAEDAAIFTNTAKFIEEMVLALSFAGETEVGGIKYNPSSIEDLNNLKLEFILKLNRIGIQFSIDALNHDLLNKFGGIGRDAFLRWITVADSKTNHTSFLTALNSMQQDGVPNTEFIDKVYTENGFVKRLANIQSAYNRRFRLNMALSLGGKKLYSITQNSSITHMINQLNSNNTENNIVRILTNFGYNVTRQNDIEIGSMILKKLLKKNESLHLTAHTYIGSRTDNKGDAGTEYKDSPMADDYIAKLTMLLQGYLIFPTLADKSTWMCLSGIDIPGLKFSSDYLLVTGAPTVMKVGNRYLLRPSDKVLAQMDEYAFTERLAIQQCMEDLGYEEIDGYTKQGRRKLEENEKIKNYHTPNKGKKIGKDGTEEEYVVEPNGTRFLNLTELIVNKNGKLVSINLNEPNMSSNDLLKRANEEYFSKSTKEQMEIMALTLAKQTSEEVKMAEKLGLIQRVDITVNGKTIISKDALGIANLENKNLNAVQINTIEQNLMESSGWKNLTPGTVASLSAKKIAHSLAIAAILQDASIKSIMSCQEVIRCFSGHMGQFKVEYDFDNNCIKDSTGDLQKRIGGLVSTGDDNITDLPNMRSTYTCAELKDYKVGSTADVADTLENMMVEGEVRDAWGLNTGDWFVAYSEPIEKLLSQTLNKWLTAAVERGKKYAKSYKSGINVADGAAYITPEMCRDLLRARGMYSKEVHKAFGMLLGPNKYNWKETKSAYKLLYETLNDLHSSLVTTKYTAYGFRNHTTNDRQSSDVAVAYYNKFALFPIFPCNATGPMLGIYEKMQSEGVDMLMFDSAVKVGSQGAVKFANGVVQGEFNKYTQEVAFLRRQLNTDPEEEHMSAFGTQAIKIALLALRLERRGEAGYKDEADPTKMRDGEELLNTMMLSINALARIGEGEVRDMFFDKSGIIDNKKLSEFLQREMGSRNASTTMLEAVQYDGRKKSTAMPLAATANSSWIQSIIIATINKKVIDIVTPGNSFVQRSVFAVEKTRKDGEGLIKSDKDIENTTINGGKKLQFINEDGSMDAVISIDYFADILKVAFPDGYSFNEARKWLFKNKIIGNSPDVKANTIGYRIPTQALSSIHALRFVDVTAGVQGDIILPEEFTKITGSDFDIDHLYLASFNYNISENGTVNTSFKSGTKLFYQNQLLSVLLTILKDEKSRNIAFKSIDNDTELPKSIADQIESKLGNKHYAYNFGTLHEQVERRLDYITGKKGIAPFALNVTNAVLTYLYNIHFKSNDFTNETRIGSLAQLVDKDGNYVSSWLSAFINAHVDIVKDPWVSKLDVNPYTYRMTNLLVRSGYGDNAVWFLSQPIIKDLAEAYASTQSEYTRESGISRYKFRKQVEKKVLLKYMDERQISEDALRPFTDSDKKYNKRRALVVNDVLMNHDLLKQFALDPEKTLKENPDFQRNVYYAFLSLDRYAKALSSLLQVTKIDTRKQGKSFLELEDYWRKYKKLFRSDKSMFDNASMSDFANRSWLDTKTELGTQLPLEIFAGQIFEANENFKGLIFGWKGLLETDEEQPLPIDTLKELSRGMITNIKSQYILKYARNILGMTDSDITALFIGKRTMASRLNSLKYAMLFVNKYKYLKGNGLLERLLVVPRSEDPNDPLFITVLDNVDGSRLDEDMLSDGWVDLLEDADPQVRRFARDLIIYSFLSSGEYSGWNKIFKYIPATWLMGLHDKVDESFADYIQKQLDTFRRYHHDTFSSIRHLIDIVSNNPRDYRLSEPVGMRDDNDNLNYTSISSQDGTTIALISQQSENVDKDPLFITMKTGSTRDISSYNTYIKIGSARKGEKRSSIYVIIKKKGYNKQNNDIYEYGWDFQYYKNGINYNVLENKERLKSVLNVAGGLGYVGFKELNYIQDLLDQEELTTGANELPDSETEIDIWWGSGEEDPNRQNADLSNFAHRPFDFREGYEDENSEAYKYFTELHPVLEDEFDSVEQAFQAFKWAHALISTDYVGEYLGLNTDERKDSESYKYGKEISDLLDEIISAETSAEAKRFGDQRGILNNSDIIWWDNHSSDIMKFLLKQSFKQNSQALQRLLDTGNATLTHKNAKGKWKTEFPKLLMEVREELRAEQEQPNVQQSEEFYSEQSALDYKQDLISSGVDPNNIKIEHIPATEDEDDYWVVSVVQQLLVDEQELNEELIEREQYEAEHDAAWLQDFTDEQYHEGC